ncbi:MAG: hypothetical protein ACRDS1_16910 [Pseudonocardiaceae bacterium]
MPTLPTTKDVRRMRKQAEAGVAVTFDAVKNPLFAVLGAMDSATHAVSNAELSKLAETWSQAMQKAYTLLVARGEQVFADFRVQPQVKRALDSVEAGVDTAQERLEVVVRDLNFATADLRSRFARTSRSLGEEVARDAERVGTAASQQVRATAGVIAEAVTDAGEEAAYETRRETRTAGRPPVPPRRSASGPADNKTSRP